MENANQTTFVATTVTEFVNNFKQFTKKSAEATVQMARVVYSASENLNDQDFNDFKNKIGFEGSEGSISKLKAIGRKYNLLSQHYEKLPVSWTTLYKIASIKEERVIKGLLEEGLIHSTMSAAEFDKLLGKEKTSKTSESNADEAPSELKFECRLANGMNEQEVEKLKSIIAELKALKVEVEVSVDVEKLLG